MRHGQMAGRAVLFDMNKVFEDFVVNALREALKLSEREFVQGGSGKGLCLDRDHLIRLKPDISWWCGRSCRFVGDVKYKRVKLDGVTHPDLYQLLAYTTATDLSQGLLIYAGGEEKPAAHQIPFADKTLHVETLDLAGEPAQVLAEVASVADVVRRLYRDSLHTEAA